MFFCVFFPTFCKKKRIKKYEKVHTSFHHHHHHHHIIIIIIMTPPPTKTAQGKQQQQQHPAKQKKELVDLECDDEFEEFEEEGALVLYRRELDLNKVASTRMMKRVVFENFFGVALLFSRALFRRASDRRTSLSFSLHPCFYAYRRVDERKRGKRRRGAMGGRLGRHGSGRFQDALERRAEKECHVATTPTKIK